MGVKLAAAEPLWMELCAALSREEETAGIILAGRAVVDDRLTLCLNRIVWVPEAEYDGRSPRQLRIRSAGWMPAVAEAAAVGWQPIFFHTHPTAPPTALSYDAGVADQLRPVFETRAGAPYASLILGGDRTSPVFTGTVAGTPISQLRVAGKRLRVMAAADSAAADGEAPQAFDRQVRAFGTDGQRLLGQLRIGVAGAGGTGSAVFEQLVRLGVGSIVTVDDDVVTETNLTRIYGSSKEDIDRPKVKVLADSAERTGLDTDVKPLVRRVTELEGFRALRDCDLIFGCTDDNAGRAVLSRLAYYYCLPVIDMGVVITANDGTISGLFSRVTVLGPGAPCLFCRRRIDPVRMREETQSPEERDRLAEEGYAQGLDDPDPSVITYTSMTASFAVDEMLQRLFGFGLDDPPDEFLIRVTDREIRHLGGESTPGHFCVDSKILGRGDRDPYLDTLWA